MKRLWHCSTIASLGAVTFAGTAVAMAAAVAANPAAKPTAVDVVATDYHFRMPASISAGPTLFHFKNNGMQLHHMTIVKLEQGKTLADFSALPPGPPPAWAVFMGGPNAPMPHGGQDDVIADLPTGHYAVICIIPGPDGKPHFMRGMARPLTVTASHQARRAPAGDLTLTLTNYAFTFSAPPARGPHAIHVVNRGTQLHEAELFRLQPGKRGEDIARWMDSGMQGPPPGRPVAGAAPLAPGKNNTLLLNLEPGRYALLCFMPDAADGKAHAAHGMIYNFTVT